MTDGTVCILFLGDIVGRPGRSIIKKRLRNLIEQYKPELVFANGENAAGGFGFNRSVAEELRQIGIDYFTLGNHTWDQKEFISEVNSIQYVCIPANFPENCPGRRYLIIEKGNLRVGLLSVVGRTFMNMILDCPFKAAEKVLNDIRSNGISNVFIDIHAETTAEKNALGWYLSEKNATAVVGTHTHVQTSDARLMHSTAYITDLGMCGAADGILGFSKTPILRRFVDGIPCRHEVSAGRTTICGALVYFNPTSGKASSIQAIQLFD